MAGNYPPPIGVKQVQQCDATIPNRSRPSRLHKSNTREGTSQNNTKREPMQDPQREQRGQRTATQAKGGKGAHRDKQTNNILPHPIREQNVQVCDATKLNRRGQAGCIVTAQEAGPQHVPQERQRGQRIVFCRGREGRARGGGPQPWHPTRSIPAPDRKSVV